MALRDHVKQHKYNRYLTGQKVRNDLLLNYHACERDPVLEETGRALTIIRNQGKNVCICDEEIEQIQNLFIKHQGPACGDVPEDYTATHNPAWVIHHPDCVRYDYWVDMVKAEAQRIGVDLSVTLKECTTVDIDLKATQTHICEVVDVGLAIQEQLCDVGVKLTAEEVAQCEVDFALKIEPLNCDVELSTVIKALECGADIDLVARALECGYTLKPTATSVDFCFDETTAIAYTRCVYNEDSMSYWTAGDGVGQVGDAVTDITVTSFVVDGTEYVPTPVELALGANVVIDGVGTYNTWLVDFINSLNISGYTASAPLPSDIVYGESIKPSAARLVNAVVISRPLGSTFVLEYNGPFSYQITESTSALVGAFSQTCAESEAFGENGWYTWCPYCVAPKVAVNVSMLLQGPWTSGTTMGTSLNALLPTNQPYSAAPYSYLGTESVGTFDANVVDWVLVKLCNPDDIFDVIAETAALLRSNGTVTSTSGGYLVFDVVPGNYKVSVHHRNHLDVVTDAAVDFSSGYAAVDFTSGLSATQKEVASGIYALYCGDVNQDHRVAYDNGYVYSDGLTILNDYLGGNSSLILVNQYSLADVNMNSNVKYSGSSNDRNRILTAVGTGTPLNVIVGQFYVP